ncbi:hypothetical protein [Nocardia sp. NPDC050793]
MTEPTQLTALALLAEPTGRACWELTVADLLGQVGAALAGPSA